MKYLNLGILSLIMLIFMSALVMAVPPVTQTGTNTGLDLAYPPYQYVQQSTDFNLFIHLFNSTKTITGDVASCYVDIYGPMGTELAHEHLTSSTNDYYTTLKAGNFSTKGYRSFIIECNTSSQSGFANGAFEVTKSGREPFTDLGVIFIWSLFILSVLLLFYTFFMTLLKLVTADETVYDVLLAWASYILVIIVNYLAGEYLLRTFVEDISAQLLTLTVWTNGVLPLLAFIITFFIKSTQKKKLISPPELGGFRYG